MNPFLYQLHLCCPILKQPWILRYYEGLDGLYLFILFFLNLRHILFLLCPLFLRCYLLCFHFSSLLHFFLFFLFLFLFLLFIFLIIFHLSLSLGFVGFFLFLLHRLLFLPCISIFFIVFIALILLFRIFLLWRTLFTHFDVFLISSYYYFIIFWNVEMRAMIFFLLYFS